MQVGVRVEAWLARRGWGLDDEEYMDPDDGLLGAQSASIAGRVAWGRRSGGRVRRYQVVGGRRVSLPARCSVYEGYNLHAVVVVRAGDRGKLERLCGYTPRSPLSRGRLSETASRDVLLRLKRGWSDGTVALVFSRAEFVEKLAALVPPARKNLVSYHGVLGARSSWRSEVVPQAPERPARGGLGLRSVGPRRGRLHWADLLYRVYEVDGWACPRCGEGMRLRGVMSPPQSMDVLQNLRRSAGRGPPEG